MCNYSCIYVSCQARTEGATSQSQNFYFRSSAIAGSEVLVWSMLIIVHVVVNRRQSPSIAVNRNNNQPLQFETNVLGNRQTSWLN